MKRYILVFVLVFSIAVIGCAPKVKLFADRTEPLKEFTLSGTGKDKVLMIPINGILTDKTRGTFIEKPSLIQTVAAQLELAEKDKSIKAVVLKINSPGGSVTASDILYHEIAAFKKRSGVKVVAAMMDVAASGGYYIALPADHIIAHPTTLTGSVGVIMMIPRVDELMNKIGVGVSVYKFGKNKDMGSMFRPGTSEENRLLQEMTDEFGRRFVGLVKTHRQAVGLDFESATTGRVFTAEEAKGIHLIDAVGYLSDAFITAKKLAGLSDDARVVVYRLTEFANDTVYNSITDQSGVPNVSLINLNLPLWASLEPGFYYLWLPGSDSF